MRIGVVADNVSPEAGGVFTFVGAVLDAVKECSSNHEFVIWGPAVERDVKWWWREAVKRGGDRVGVGHLMRSTARRIRSVKATLVPSEISPIERFLREANIGVMWFLSQTNEPVSVPYITTVWDLQHRNSWSSSFLPIQPNI